MSESHKNIYITIIKALYGYAIDVYRTIKRLFMGSSSPSIISPLLDEIVSGGPNSFQKHPTAIRLGRALFVPLILISHLYDRK